MSSLVFVHLRSLFLGFPGLLRYIIHGRLASEFLRPEHVVAIALRLGEAKVPQSLPSVLQDALDILQTHFLGGSLVLNSV